MPLPTHPSDRSGRTTHKTGTSVRAWPFGPASVSVEKLSPAVLALSPFPASPFPRLPESPYRDFHPSGFLLFLQIHAFSKAPSLHGRYPASSLLWTSPTPDTTAAPAMSSRRAWLTFPRRLAGPPRLLDR